MTEDRPYLYAKIVEELREKIESGELEPGDQLPSRPEIQRLYGVSNSVALKVSQILVSEGLAEARAGSGTYVRARPKRRTLVRNFTLRLTDSGSSAVFDLPEQGHQVLLRTTSRPDVAPGPVRERLRMDPAGEEPDVIRTESLFEVDGVPSEKTVSWELLAITGGTPVMIPGKSENLLGIADRFRSIGVIIAGCVDQVDARIAIAEEVEALRVPPGSVVHVLTRTHYDLDGRPVETAESVLSAERYTLTYGEALPTS
ncbi:GntR family transcriptional regulator [Herbidospora daliensis]|uniref:GntR family transcriptional regulator n=1 Tax=Herbidospora daliensis TaxID=295585 RepID=UPI0007859F59|nr:GntR family transcriptional regulator [Herbidospora daliensis]